MTMRVDLIAATIFETERSFLDDVGWTAPLVPAWGEGEGERDADLLAEFAGRSCYQSWSRPNPATATNEGYLANILGQGHFSVLEHASATFYIQGVSRALTHELVRHRHLSFSQLSQRFVNEEDSTYVTPPALQFGQGTEEYLSSFYEQAINVYSTLVSHLTAEGLPRKQAREAARAVLPNMTETRIVVTGNHRAWRDFLGKRWSVHADAEIRELAGEILKDLRIIAPHSFQDIPETPYE